MKKEIISSKQAFSIMVYFIIGSTLVIGSTKEAQQDVWISILIGMAIAMPMVAIYARIIKLYPNKNLFDITEELFGKIVGKILTLLFTWYFFHLGALVIRDVTEFIQVISFPETPQFFVAFFILVLIIYTAKSGVEVLVRLLEFILPVLIFIFLITIILSIPKMNINNIKPILYNGWKPVLKNGFSYFAFPFAEVVIFTVILSSLDQKYSKPYKVYFLSLFTGGSLILFAIIRNILTLGMSNISISYFPSYSAVSVVGIGNFIQRIEVIVSITLLISCYAKISVCLLATNMGISKLFNLHNYNEIVAPVALLMTYLSNILFSNVAELFEWTIIYIYYTIPFQIILPLIIWITAEVKVRSNP